jgi:hypothetical protein
MKDLNLINFEEVYLMSIYDHQRPLGSGKCVRYTKDMSPLFHIVQSVVYDFFINFIFHRNYHDNNENFHKTKSSFDSLLYDNFEVKVMETRYLSQKNI